MTDIYMPALQLWQKGNRREAIAIVTKLVEEGDVYDVGDRVAQLVIMKLPFVEITEVAELSSSERGEGGFGSTGK